jgi:predicted AAA+ superfamily ATPase
MPSIDWDFLSKLQDDKTKYVCFVETGTYNGDTIFALEPYFDKLYTIEFSEKYYSNTKNSYNGNKINFILGDSSVVFQDLLPNITDKKRMYFREAYHPILYLNNKEKKEITYPQTIELHHESRVIVISGPNAGGKTISLKTVGLHGHFKGIRTYNPTKKMRD